jgi:hypothetical protein
VTLPSKYRSPREQAIRSNLIICLIVGGVIAIPVYLGIKDILEADIKVHLAAFSSIIFVLLSVH